MSGFQTDASPFPILTASSSLAKHSTPKRTAKIGDAYVLQIAEMDSHYAIAASAPSNAIHLFDKSTLQNTGGFAGHSEGVSAIVKQVGKGSSLLSCGKDARIKVWDERSQKSTLECTSCHTSVYQTLI
jgi:WD40 repeat protein